MNTLNSLSNKFGAKHFPQKIAFAQSLDAPTNFYHLQNIDLAIVLGI